jgi:hypothetical protein
MWKRCCVENNSNICVRTKRLYCNYVLVNVTANKVHQHSCYIIITSAVRCLLAPDEAAGSSR